MTQVVLTNNPETMQQCTGEGYFLVGKTPMQESDDFKRPHVPRGLDDFEKLYMPALVLKCGEGFSVLKEALEWMGARYQGKAPDGHHFVVPEGVYNVGHRFVGVLSHLRERAAVSDQVWIREVSRDEFEKTGETRAFSP